ncbi:MAG: hypothetical protein ACT4TC_13770 [Myxococcaceae bacterium]
MVIRDGIKVSGQHTSSGPYRESIHVDVDDEKLQAQGYNFDGMEKPTVLCPVKLDGGQTQFVPIEMRWEGRSLENGRVIDHYSATPPTGSATREEGFKVQLETDGGKNTLQAQEENQRYVLNSAGSPPQTDPVDWL